MATNFNYQNLQRQVIESNNLSRFIWMHHNFATSYKEPFERVTVGNSQGYIPDTSVKPVRIFTLNFSTLNIQEPDEKSNSALRFSPELDFEELKAFYIQHQTHTQFIYPHPVYGDIIVRFFKPLSVPKKNLGGVGSVQAFTVELIEVITTDYTFQKREDFSGDMPLFLEYYDVEIEYPDNTLLIPMGGNYTMVFESTQKPLRKFTLSCVGLRYFLDGPEDEIILDRYPEQNMALLEIFYLKNRLDKVFEFNYMGEVIPVRFNDPLSIPPVGGNLGVINMLQVTFIETPYPVIPDLEIVNA